MEFENIWNANSSHLKNFIATKVPEEEISDILQNVSIELFKSIEGGKTLKNSKSWLFQVTRNIIADFYKRKAKTLDSETTFSSITQEDFQLCVCDFAEQIISALLPATYSTPLILSDVRKIPQKAIATQLGLSYENTKSRILRARVKLKEAVKESVEFYYSSKGEIIGGELKAQNNFPAEVIKLIEKVQ